MTVLAIERTLGTAVASGSVDLPEGWRHPDEEGPFVVSLPDDIEPFAATRFVANISVALASTAELDEEWPPAGIPVGGADLAVSPAGVRRRSRVVVSDLPDRTVVQLVGRVSSTDVEDIELQVVGTADARDWDRVADAFDAVVASAELVAVEVGS